MTERDDHLRFVRERWPELDIASLEPIGDGWDCFTYRADDQWIFQFPKRARAADGLRRQHAFLPELAREVSATVPVPERWSEDPTCLGYRLIGGVPADGAFLADAAGLLPERLGRFLYDLHMVPVEYLGLRPVGPRAWRDGFGGLFAELRARVVPLLDARSRASAEELFSSFLASPPAFATAFHHGDLGPLHILRSPSGDLAGVIGWGEAEVGDPARDFGWLLFARPEIGERVLAAYGGAPDAGFRERALFYHRLGPWYEVLHGLDTARPAFVKSGLEGVRERLDRSAGSTFASVAGTMGSPVRRRSEGGADVTDDDKGLLDKAKDVASEVVDKAKDVTGDVVEKAKPLLDKAGDAAGSAFDKAKDVTGDVVEKAKPLIDKAGDAAGSLLDKAKDALTGDKGEDPADG